MPQVIFRLISGHSIRLDVEGSITVDQLRERMLPVYRELTDVPLHEMKLMFVKEEAQKNLFGRQTVKVELGNGRRSLHDYGVGQEAGQRALIVVLPTVRQWGLRMLIAIKLDDMERCQQAVNWHPSSIHWAVRREVRTIEIPVPDDFDDDELPAPEVVSYLTYGDFEAAGEDMPPLPDDFGRLEGGWVEGDTGLHLAVRNRAEQVCQFLVEHGSPLTAKNVNGCTPLDEARKLRDNDALVAMLDRPQEDLMWQVTPRQGSNARRSDAQPPPSRSSTIRHSVGPKASARKNNSASPATPKRRAPGSTPSPAALAAARAAAGITDEDMDSGNDTDSDNDGPATMNGGSKGKAVAASASNPPAPERRTNSNPPAPERRTNNNPPAPVRRTNNNMPAPERRTNNSAASTPTAKAKTREQDKTKSHAATKLKAAASAKKKKTSGSKLWGDADEGSKGSGWLTTPLPTTELEPQPESNDELSSTQPDRTSTSEGDTEAAAEAARAARAARLEREAAAKARREKAEQGRLEREAKKRAREEASAKAATSSGKNDVEADEPPKQAKQEERIDTAKQELEKQSEEEQEEDEEENRGDSHMVNEETEEIATDDNADWEPCADFYLGDYECMKKSQIRSGWQMASNKSGVLLLEEEVEVVEARRIVSTGIVRCRLSGDRGWVSEKTADGEIILEVLPTE